MTLTFNELLNCLQETDKSIKRTNAELEDLYTAYADSQSRVSEQQAAINVLESTLDHKASRIEQLNRQAIAQRVIGAALCFDMLDIPYKFGGTWEKNKTFDCSSFMQICFQIGTQGAVTLPRTSHNQSLAGVEVPFDQIEPGDTLHYDFDGDGKVTHVGLAMGNGMMIHTNNPQNNINIIPIAEYNRGRGLVRVRRHIIT